MKTLVNTSLLTAAFSLLSFNSQAQDGLRGMDGDWALLITHSTVTVLLLVVFLVLAGVLRNLTTSSRIIEMIRNNRNNLPILLAVGFLGLSSSANAQEAAGLNFSMTTDLTWAFILADVTLILFVFIEIALIRRILRMASLEEAKAEVEEESSEISFAGIKLTDNIPLDRENEVMTDHEYDGIRELDNNLPPWWVYGFYLTIIIGVIYLINYHVLDGELQAEEYKTEMAEAQQKVDDYISRLANRVDETNVELLADESSLALGKEIYTANCTACHGDLGEGGVGPTFADRNWIHGGGIVNVFKTIKYGVPEKGMISWQSQLSPSQMQQVASYLLGFEGTSPPGIKEPQGDVWTAEPAAEEVPASEAEVTEEVTETAEL